MSAILRQCDKGAEHLAHRWTDVDGRSWTCDGAGPRRPEWMTPTDAGYRATCDRCGWSKEYPRKASARGGLSAHRCV